MTNDQTYFTPKDSKKSKLQRNYFENHQTSQKRNKADHHSLRFPSLYFSVIDNVKMTAILVVEKSKSKTRREEKRKQTDFLIFLVWELGALYGKTHFIVAYTNAHTIGIRKLEIKTDTGSNNSTSSAADHVILNNFT